MCENSNWLYTCRISTILNKKCNIDPLESKKKAISSLTRVDLPGFRGQKKNRQMRVGGGGVGDFDAIRDG